MNSVTVILLIITVSATLSSWGFTQSSSSCSTVPPSYGPGQHCNFTHVCVDRNGTSESWSIYFSETTWRISVCSCFYFLVTTITNFRIASRVLLTPITLSSRADMIPSKQSFIFVLCCFWWMNFDIKLTLTFDLKPSSSNLEWNLLWFRLTLVDRSDILLPLFTLFAHRPCFFLITPTSQIIN
jgi:hypothetical protein